MLTEWVIKSPVHLCGPTQNHSPLNGMHACFWLVFECVCMYLSLKLGKKDSSVNSYERWYEMGKGRLAYIPPFSNGKSNDNKPTNKQTNCCTFYHEFKSSRFSMWVPKSFYKCTNTNTNSVHGKIVRCTGKTKQTGSADGLEGLLKSQSRYAWIQI